MKGGDGALPAADRETHHAAADRRRTPQARPEGSRADPRRDGRGAAARSASRARCTHSSTPCAPSDKFKPRSRAALSEDFQRVARQVRRADPAPTSPPCPRPRSRSGRIPPYPREVRGGRQLRTAAAPDGARPGVFYYNTYDLPAAAHVGMTARSTSTKARRGTTSRSAWRRRTPRCPPSCASAATPPTSKAGRSMPRRSATRWGCTRIPTSASARSTTRCCGRCGWWSTPASMPRAGPASRRSTTCSPTRAMGRTDATAEVERYIAIPGQALAYKIGALTIQRLRDKAEGGAGRAVRHPRVPRPGARHRRAAAARARTQDRRLDRRRRSLGVST